jgi:heme-degrading monooxygenase HmoA
MIARVWQGVAPEAKTSEHLKYIQGELFGVYREAPGNRGAILLSRRRTDCTEFLLLSLWESASFLESLTGPDVDGAMARELINPSPTVKNYEVVVSTLAAADQNH